MATEPKEGQRTYWCFISYRHADNEEPGRQWATWLHQAIETYEVPTDLVGSKNERGETIPARIFPVFRDEEELPADADLGSPVYRALDNSKFLVVLCSPRAVKSTYVANEIRYFKQIGREDRVLAAMIEGEPNASWDPGKQSAGIPPEEECFPEPLRYRVDSAGQLLQTRAEPIAADFRLDDRAQGWASPEAYRLALKERNQLDPKVISKTVEDYRKKCELMKLKIIAGILGVGLGTLTRRDAAFQLTLARKRTRTLRRWLVAVGVLAILAVAGGVFAVSKQREAEYQRDLATQAHRRLLSEAAAARLRERDVRMAQGIILEVLSHRPPGRFPEPETNAIFQEARAADWQLVGLSGHTGSVRSALYSPDGKHVVTASFDKTARIWDESTGALIASIVGHDADVRWASYSSDGTRLVTASADKTARVWDPATGKQLAVLSGPNVAVNCAVFSPDGKSIATALDDGTARIWDASTFQQRIVLSGHDGVVSSVAYSPDGRRIVTASADKTARIWDAVRGNELKVLSGHSENVLSAGFSPDGKHVATGSQDKTGRIWDAATGASISLLYGHLGTVHSVTYSPDGRFVLTSSFDRTLRIWDAATGALFRVLSGHFDNILTAAYSPDGTHFVTASDDKSARIWSATPLAQLSELLGHAELVSSVAYSPDGTRVVTTSADKSVRIWDVSTANQIGSLSGHGGLVNSAFYSADGKRIVTACYDQSTRIWDANTFKLLFVLGGHTGFVTSAVFSADGSRIATASFDKTIDIWDGHTGARLAVITGHGDIIRSVMFSPDGKHVVSASDDKTARIWDPTTGTQEIILNGHTDALRSANYSPDGSRIVTASNDKTARIWDADSGKELLSLIGHSDALRSAAYSPDGKRIVTAAYDKTARIWDAVTGLQLAVLPVHGDGVRAARYSPDGARIVTASLDTSATIWDAQIQADVDAQIVWLEAAEFDPMSDSERFQLGLSPVASAGSWTTEVEQRRQLTAQESQDPSRTVALYEEAWNKRMPFAAFELGKLYEHGGRAQVVTLPADSSKAWFWYQKAADAGYPGALARLAQRSEVDAASEVLGARKIELLLTAFEYYAAASRRAEGENWPDDEWKDWRFRRATLARLLARDGMMQQVAERDRRTLARWSSTNSLSKFQRLRRWLNL